MGLGFSILSESNISSVACLDTELSQRPKEQNQAFLGRLASIGYTAHAASFRPQNVGISVTVLVVE